jgi:uncharacterized protein YfaS (alpha-2-macroglobulin family)
VGLKKPQEGYASPNEDVALELVVVNRDGVALGNREVEVSFYRIYWQSILKKDKDSDSYRYTSEKTQEKTAQFSVTSLDGVTSFKVRPEEYGQFLVVARDVQSGGSASLTFYASGWGYAPWSMDRPGRVELDLDKKKYRWGETAKVQVRAPFSGKMIVTVEREKILHQETLMLKENTGALEIPVREEYEPNVYVSVHLIRSTESLERNTPVRAFGVIPLLVETEAHRLAVEVEAPQKIRGKAPLKVRVKVRKQSENWDNATKKRPYVTLAAVDEGICQLNDFQTPDPYAFFYGKKRLSVDSYDTYGAILPEIPSSLSSPSGGAGSRRRHLSPAMVRRVKPVAFWSGLTQTDDNGTASVVFEIPEFNGTVRLMAAAFLDDQMGSAEKSVLVREPIVLTPTFPRFIGSTDRFVVPVNLYNGTQDQGTFSVQLSAEGPVRVLGDRRRSVSVAKGEEGQVFFEVEAEKSMGKATFKLSAKGNGEETEASTDVPVRPPVPVITLAGGGSLEEGKPARFTLPSDWIPGSADFSLSGSSFPSIRFAGSLQYLLQYPHGCLEQTTSKLFPLLSFNDLARLVEPELFKRTPVDYFIQEGIAKLESLQQSSGAFSFWPSGSEVNGWSSIYASHFLVEARKAGYTVSDQVYKRMLSSLRRYTRNYAVDNQRSIQLAVYACYVLALADKPEKSTVLYLKNHVLDKLSEYSLFQLAGAFAHSGDSAAALSLLPKTAPPVSRDEKRESGGNFNSPVRAKAIMLEVLADVDPRSPSVPALVESLVSSASKGGTWGTTQENAYAFLALGKILKKQTQANYTGTVTLDNRLLSHIDTGDFHSSGKDWGGKGAVIEIQGAGACYYHWRADGLPASVRIDEYDNDLMVRRRYLDKHGAPVNHSLFRQGDLIIAEITVKALKENLENVVIVDMLPAGFEIENPRIQSRKGIDWIGKEAYQPQYMDIRDDRMVLYGGFEINQVRKFYYALRVVTEGTFLLPPIRAEAMYAPMKASVASSGSVTVSKP